MLINVKCLNAFTHLVQKFYIWLKGSKAINNKKYKLFDKYKI